MSVGQEFWVVATGAAAGDKVGLLSNLKSAKVLSGNGLDPINFNVPDDDKSLMFGSFDNLIRLTDELQKYDSQVDSILHRIERQYLELDPKAVFKVKAQRQEKDFMDYLKNWQWDEAKYPKSRSIADTVQVLMTNVNRLDEEARTKTAQYNELKSQKGNLSQKDGTLVNKDLVDLMTPDKVKMTGKPDDDFIYTEHLTTVCVVLGRGMDKDFLSVYEKICDNVVPKSAKHFENFDDKDKNMVWRVVMFKSSEEAFKKGCRDRRFMPRDFEYSAEGYAKLVQQRQQVDESVKRQHELVKSLYQGAWSDAMVAVMHIKAMRVFVESVLRFGMPPKFASFIVSPKSNAAAAARKKLADTLGKGQQGYDKMKLGDKQEDDEEYFPYVSIPFTPFNVHRG